jgi:hypothetical protein
MRVRSSIGVVLGGGVAICCAATQAPTAGGSRVDSSEAAGSSGASAAQAGNAGQAGGSLIKPPEIQTEGGAQIMDAPDHPVPTCFSACNDLPAAPIMDPKGPTMPPANAATLFGPATNRGSMGPCVFEPQLAQGSDPGTLFPANWLRPRFRFTPLAGENLWEIRLHADLEANDLVVYTTATTYTLPKDIWTALANNVLLKPITVTIRGLNTAAPGTPSGTSGSFQVAPVYAGGAMVYWASTTAALGPLNSKLVGFRVGDESVINALTIPQVTRQVIDVQGQAQRPVVCIGCHTSTPDGKSVGFADGWPWNGLLASIEGATVGQQPAYVSAGAATLLNQPFLGMLTFSKGQWADGKHLVVTGYSARDIGVGFTNKAGGAPSTLAWFNLDTPATIPWTAAAPGPTNTAIMGAEKMAWGLLPLMGETASAITPAFSHDGKSVFYTSATTEQDGRVGDKNTDVNIHVVPFNDSAGGTVTALAGASEPNVAEYYPNLSIDDRLVAFNRLAPLDQDPIYYRAEGEVNVIPSTGGKAKRLPANDPVACGGQKSPGVLNSWAKWSPAVKTVDGKNYYWLIFSSARAYPGQFNLPAAQSKDARSSQLYMTAVVEDTTTHELTGFDGAYLWNQDPATTNLTPAWDEFEIPAVPPPK